MQLKSLFCPVRKLAVSSGQCLLIFFTLPSFAIKFVYTNCGQHWAQYVLNLLNIWNIPSLSRLSFGAIAGYSNRTLSLFTNEWVIIISLTCLSFWRYQEILYDYPFYCTPSVLYFVYICVSVLSLRPDK